jgi:starch-binding outer membrane protein, SusD/RagB family
MKMTILKNRFIVFSIVLLFLSSCQDNFLELDPKTSIHESEAFSTPAKILAQVNNLYGKLQNPSLYGGRYLVFNEQRGDEFGQNDGNAATGSAVWNQNVASTNEFINDVWGASYAGINACNILIEKMQNTTVISDSIAKQYIAEAKFVRALNYFVLVQTYAKPFNQDANALGVPLRLKGINSAGHNDLARSTVSEVYVQIIKDLDEAEQGLPDSRTSPLLNISRANKSTAIALKTRVFLNQNQFQKVKDEAEKIVSPNMPFNYVKGSLSHYLETNINDIFTGSYTGGEAIFSIPFANSITETPPAQSALAFNYVSQPIIFMAKEGIINNTMWTDKKDARSYLIGTNKANQKILLKFSITTAPFRDYVPVLRYAEIILNYAEAAAHTGEIEKAKELLGAIRYRSNPDHIFKNEDICCTEALIETIITERRIELLGEGLRLQDLQRRVKNLPSKTGAIGTAPEVNSTAKNYIWPIPSGELSTNKFCLPN